MTSRNGSTALPPPAVSMTPNGGTSASPNYQAVPTPSSRVTADSDQEVTGMKSMCALLGDS